MQIVQPANRSRPRLGSGRGGEAINAGTRRRERKQFWRRLNHPVGRELARDIAGIVLIFQVSFLTLYGPDCKEFSGIGTLRSLKFCTPDRTVVHADTAKAATSATPNENGFTVCPQPHITSLTGGTLIGNKPQALLIQLKPALCSRRPPKGTPSRYLGTRPHGERERCAGREPGRLHHRLVGERPVNKPGKGQGKIQGKLRGPSSKVRPSDGCGRKTTPMAAGFG